MKTIHNNLLAHVLFVVIVIGFGVGNTTAKMLTVDSVTVDSVWQSDSAVYDANGILQQRQSRDCIVTFIPQGEGNARIFIALSIDSGKTWLPSGNPLSVLNDTPSSTYVTGQRASITVRVLGGDRVSVVFRVTARQSAPVLEGNPKLKMLSVLEALTPEQSVSAAMSVRVTNATSSDGFSAIDKVCWDALADGTTDDSTMGENVLTWTWSTQAPSGISGQRRAVIARAIDKNGLASNPETLSVQFGLKRALVMKDIPAGLFTMGSNNSLDAAASPSHPVTLSKFKMQETELTQEQYQAVMGTNPAYYKMGDSSALRPVEQVSWYNAVRFCNKLSVMSGLTEVYDTIGWTADFSKAGYRLPTEAQWEYACRGGTSTGFFWGDDSTEAAKYAWYLGTSGFMTHLVGGKLSNSYGLFDMNGNVWEMTNDWYEMYMSSAQTDPTGPVTGSRKICRGGSAFRSSTHLRAAYRSHGNLEDAYSAIGFRVAIPAQ